MTIYGNISRPSTETVLYLDNITTRGKENLVIANAADVRRIVAERDVERVMFSLGHGIFPSRAVAVNSAAFDLALRRMEQYYPAQAAP